MAKAKKVVEETPVEAPKAEEKYVVAGSFIDSQNNNVFMAEGSEYSGTDSGRIAHLEKIGLIKKAK